jgi:ubiquinone/menaquinone biosynthesis C-methylase UbiE
MLHQLYGQFASRYDLHTPAGQHRHNHAFVIEECLRLGPNPHLLDVGCGTGVLIQKACDAGIAAFGIDPSPAMIEVCRGKFDAIRVRQSRVEELDDQRKFDCITSLSWSLNYCDSVEQFVTGLQRLYSVLRPGGLIILEIPNAAAARGIVVEERKAGPTGLPDDVLFVFRFESLDGDTQRMVAKYVYACSSLNDLMFEEHILNLADPLLVADLLLRAGFENVTIFNSWRKDPFAGSISPFVMARRT